MAIAVKKVDGSTSSLNLRERLLSLNATDRAQVIKKIGEDHLQQLISISQESNTQIQQQRYFALGDSLERGGRLDLASTVYQEIAQGKFSFLVLAGTASKTVKISPLLQQKANQRLQVFQGRGPLLEQTAFVYQHTSRELFSLTPYLALGGGLATYRLIKAGGTAAVLTINPLARLSAKVAGVAMGFGAEGWMFPFISKVGGKLNGTNLSDSILPNSQELLSSYLMLGPAKGMTVTAGKLLPAITEISSPSISAKITKFFIQQSATASGIMMGKGLEEFFQLRDRQPLTRNLIETLAMSGQYAVMHRINPIILGKNFQRWTDRIELQTEWRLNQLNGLVSFKPIGLQWAEAGGPILSKMSEGPKLNGTNGGGGWKSNPRLDNPRFLPERYPLFPIPPEAARLKTEFEPIFRAQAAKWGMQGDNYSDAVVANILQTPCEISGAHRKLLEGLAKGNRPGSLEQFVTSFVIKTVYSLNSLGTATGTLNNARLQYALNQSLALSDPFRRHLALQSIFRSMQEGIPPLKILEQLQRIGVVQSLSPPTNPVYPQAFFLAHQKTIQRDWQGYSSSDQSMLLNFIYQQTTSNPLMRYSWIKLFGAARRSRRYNPHDIDAALKAARTDPFGTLNLNKMLNIFAVRDPSAKLKELGSEPTQRDTLHYIQALSAAGKNPQEIAAQIHGTWHTAFFEDEGLRLNLKIVRTALQIEEHLSDPTRLKKGRDFMEKAHSEFVKSGKLLDEEGILEVLKINPHSSTETNPETAWITQLIKTGKIKLVLQDAKELNERIRRWGMVSHALGLQVRGSNGGAEEIHLPIPTAFPSPLSLADLAEGTYQLRRLRNTVLHEGEHVRHFSGDFDGIEIGSKPFERPTEPRALHRLPREEWVKPEIMSELVSAEDQVGFMNSIPLMIAQQMGDNLPLYYRSFGENSYFKRYNEILAENLRK